MSGVASTCGEAATPRQLSSNEARSERSTSVTIFLFHKLFLCALFVFYY